LTNMWQDTIFLQNNVEYPFQNMNKSITINPAIHKTDGFFISIFQRKR
jgi:16S rRNA C967 or C1407 C5-methylase (RsmB/RsmF family)